MTDNTIVHPQNFEDTKENEAAVFADTVLLLRMHLEVDTIADNSIVSDTYSIGIALGTSHLKKIALWRLGLLQEVELVNKQLLIAFFLFTIHPLLAQKGEGGWESII